MQNGLRIAIVCYYLLLTLISSGQSIDELRGILNSDTPSIAIKISTLQRLANLEKKNAKDTVMILYYSDTLISRYKNKIDYKYIAKTWNENLWFSELNVKEI